MTDTIAPTPETESRVVYLLGAGATHGCIQALGVGPSVVMPGLAPELQRRMHDLWQEHYETDETVRRLVNDVVDSDTDFEQLITFLEDSPSGVFRAFARDLKTVFSDVLRSALEIAEREYEPFHSGLYAVLVDLHRLSGTGEALSGFLTLNYDWFLEHAIEYRHGLAVDFGIHVDSTGDRDDVDRIPVLKLHGSFGWTEAWPIRRAAVDAAEFWIPPGIRKAKSEYPFNAIWGAARELLDCDVVRILGCNLGPNDWDLVSLLFTTMHAHVERGTYEVEVISWPDDAQRMAETFPYLKVRSLFDLPELGRRFIGEVLGEEHEFDDLDEATQELAMKAAKSKVSNPFESWLRLKAEQVFEGVQEVPDERSIFQTFLDS